jgi:hypothetical protein
VVLLLLSGELFWSLQKRYFICILFEKKENKEGEVKEGKNKKEKKEYIFLLFCCC